MTQRSPHTRPLLCALIAAAAGSAWVMALFTGPAVFSYDGDRQYLVTFHRYGIDLCASRCVLQTVRQQGCIGRIVNETTVPFRGVRHWPGYDRHRFPALGTVRASVVKPGVPLPPTRLLPDGSSLRSGFEVVGRRLSVPYWVVIACAIVLPGRWSILRLRRGWHEHRRIQLQRHGLCAACGYDLRATPDLCPECGGVPDVCSDNLAISRGLGSSAQAP